MISPAKERDREEEKCSPPEEDCGNLWHHPEIPSLFVIGQGLSLKSLPSPVLVAWVASLIISYMYQVGVL